MKLQQLLRGKPIDEQISSAAEVSVVLKIGIIIKILKVITFNLVLLAGRSTIPYNKTPCV